MANNTYLHTRLSTPNIFGCTSICADPESININFVRKEIHSWMERRPSEDGSIIYVGMCKVIEYDGSGKLIGSKTSENGVQLIIPADRPFLHEMFVWVVDSIKRWFKH